MEYLDRKILADVFQAGVLTLTGGAARPACSAVEDEVVALFDEYREPLLRYLTTFGVCAADAEELLQDVFLALFLHLRGGKSRANLRGWLFRVAHNLALKRRERDRRGLWLRAEGLNYREIAAVLEISLGAVALSLARSLARLERCAER